ncbi:MAG: MFS transporter, partial [Victivallales bacterium]|nr:MFS transporter [Victivallales bacterium]
MSESENKKSSWKLNLVMLWFSQLLVMAGFSAMIPFIPLFLKDELMVTDKQDLALYITLFNFFGTMAYAIFVPIWGFLSDRFGVKPMLLRGTFVTAFIYPCMGYVTTPAMLVFLRFATAACAGTTSASQTMIARTTPDNRQGFALGLLSTAIWGGSMLGNVVGGLIIHYYNYLYAFWLCGILYFIAGFAVLFTKDDGARIPLHANPVAETKHVRLAPRWLPDFGQAIWFMVLLFFTMGIIRGIETPYIALRIETIVGKGNADY